MKDSAPGRSLLSFPHQNLSEYPQSSTLEISSRFWSSETQRSMLMLGKNLLPLFLHSTYSIFMGRGSSVGLANGYGLDNRGVGVRVPVEPRIFTSPHRPDQLWRPSSLQSKELLAGIFPPGITRLRREADHSPATSDEIKKTWIYTFTPPYVHTLPYLAQSPGRDKIQLSKKKKLTLSP
jgi:hypothetical protein